MSGGGWGERRVRMVFAKWSRLICSAILLLLFVLLPLLQLQRGLPPLKGHSSSSLPSVPILPFNTIPHSPLSWTANGSLRYVND